VLENSREMNGGLKYDPLGWRREEWSRRKMLWHFAGCAAMWFFSFSLDEYFLKPN
jgi:hypothetical protein